MAKSVLFHIKRMWGFIKELGLSGFVGGSIMASILGGIGWLHDKLPWSILLLICLIGFAMFSAGYYHFVLSHRVSRFNPTKYRELGHKLVVFSRDALRTMNEWDRDHPPVVREADQQEDPSRQWEEERRREAERASAFVERHMSQAIAHVATLRGLGIYPPFHVGAGAMSRPHGFVVYLGAVGSLLEQGQIEEARAMSDLPTDGRIPPFAFHMLS